MNFKTILAIKAGNLAKIIVLKLKKGSAEALPGLVALKIDPNFISHFHKNIQTKILITGTNGKTTTTNLFSQILKNSDIKFLTNSNGSNLERGLASLLLKKTENTNTVLWEVDEAAFIPIAIKTNPTHIVITNLFRDQLDRYGEINTTYNKWLKCLENLPKTTLILNVDDPSLAFLGQKLKHIHQIIYFGLKTQVKNTTLKHSADAIYCPNCNQKLKYQNITFSHLGDYSCKCKFKKPKPDFTASKIETSFNGSIFSIINTNLESKLLGLYNIYNCLAAYTLSKQLQLNEIIIKDTFKNFQPVKGRQEIINKNGKNIQLWLVKNPTGFDQVIDTLELLNKKIILCLALNDQIADGKDVSWIWDVDFEKLNKITYKIILTGDRVYDLALRLKYANFNTNKVTIQKSNQYAIDYLLNQTDKNLFILPTYTALWELRKLLIKSNSITSHSEQSEESNSSVKI